MSQNDFRTPPMHTNGRPPSLADSTDTLLITTHLYRYKDGVGMDPCQRWYVDEENEVSVMLSDLGDRIYLWNGKRLYGIDMKLLLQSARFHLCGVADKKDKKPKKKPKAEEAPLLDQDLSGNLF